MESKRSLKLALLVSICFIVGLTGMAFMPTSLSAGGPTKAAILGSTLMGSVSGSAAANVLVTGSISIPLMKKLGYEPSFDEKNWRYLPEAGPWGKGLFRLVPLKGPGPYIVVLLK